MTNVVQFGKKPKQTPPPPPVDGDMTGYQTAMAITKHFGIAISTEDAIKLDRALRGLMFHAQEAAREVEREECAKLCDKWSKREDDVGAFIGKEIRARGNT